MINDRELRLLAVAGSLGVWSMQGWARIFGWILERDVTVDEAADAIRRINGPAAPGTTYADIVRSTEIPNGWKVL